jgi:hypothetical protein
VGSKVTAWGLLPVELGSPAEASAPVVLSMAKTATSFEPWFATYRNRPFGSTASDTGSVPEIANGEPATGVRKPAASMD